MPVGLEVRCPSDEEVMVNLQASDSNALHVLFDRYSRLVLSIARGIIRDRGKVEDIVQDMFFYFYQKSMQVFGERIGIDLFAVPS
jgi:RNA polymerase sigma-70 factor, ECF subfamily